MTGSDLKDLRRRLGLTQLQLSERLGYKTSFSVSRYERGERPVPEEIAQKAREIETNAPAPSTGEDLRRVRERLGLSRAALAPLISRSPSSVARYEGEYEQAKGVSAGDPLPSGVAQSLRSLRSEKTPIAPGRYARLTGQPLLPELSDELAAQLAGEPCRLLPFSSSQTPMAAHYAVGQSGAPYTLRAKGCTLVQERRVGGAWTCAERSTSGETVSLRIQGKDTAMGHARLIALAWTDGPPFESAEAYLLDEEKPPTPENVAWRSPVERWQEYVDETKNAEDRPTTVTVSNEVALRLRERYPEEVRRHGVTYLIEKILRQKLALSPLLTPHQRKTGSRPGTKAAQIRLAARRNPGLKQAEIAETLGDVTPAYVNKVLAESGVSLEELRRRKRRDEALEEARLENRRRAIVSDAESGLFTSREIQERYGVDRTTVRSVLSEAGVSLAEAKRRRGARDGRHAA